MIFCRFFEFFVKFFYWRENIEILEKLKFFYRIKYARFLQDIIACFTCSISETTKNLKPFFLIIENVFRKFIQKLSKHYQKGLT